MLFLAWVSARRDQSTILALGRTPVAKAAKSKKEVPMDRRTATDRRSNKDRRKENKPVAQERRTLERRAKVNRRRQIDPTTCERDYTGEEIEFMQAMDAYKRRSGRMFPTCSEILEVVRELGYVRPEGEAASQAAVESQAAEDAEDDSNDDEVGDSDEQL